MNQITSAPQLTGKDFQRQSFDINLLGYDDVKGKHPGYLHLINYLFPVENKSILDCGIDGGTFSLMLYMINANVTSIDVQRNTITVLERDSREKTFKYKISPDNFDFLPEDTYDSVVFKYVFSSFSNKHAIDLTINSIYRSLKPGGSFIILDSLTNQSGDEWSKSVFVDLLSLTGFSITAIHVPEILLMAEKTISPYYIIYAVK